MATTTRTKTWVSGDVLTAADLNAEFDGLLGALGLVNADIAAGAGIVYSKLNLTGAILNADLAGSIDASKISNTAATLTGTENLTNKTLTSPVINGATGTGALNSKVITATRDLTASTGDVSYTGVGFQPTSIHSYSQLGLADSNGFSDSSKVNKCIVRLFNGTETDVYSALIMAHAASGNYQEAIVSSYDADGFTLTWTKTSSPTGTAKLIFLCLK